MVQNFITTIHNPSIINALEKSLDKVVDNKTITEIKKIVKSSSETFKEYNTEPKILTLYRNLGLYDDPIDNYTTKYRKI